jgi:hypothetical protein
METVVLHMSMSMLQITFGVIGILATLLGV